MKADVGGCRRSEGGVKADVGGGRRISAVGWATDRPGACQKCSTFKENTYMLHRCACFYDISLDNHDCVSNLTKKTFKAYGCHENHLK